MMNDCEFSLKKKSLHRVHLPLPYTHYAVVLFLDILCFSCSLFLHFEAYHYVHKKREYTLHIRVYVTSYPAPKTLFNGFFFFFFFSTPPAKFCFHSVHLFECASDRCSRGQDKTTRLNRYDEYYGYYIIL